MIKKFTTILAVLFFFAGAANAQLENPVKWSYTAKKVADKTYELHIKAYIDGNWHLYSQETGEGPEPTSVKFAVNPLVKLDGKVKEAGTMEKVFDPNFNSTMKYYSKEVDFVQKIKVRSTANTLVKGSVTYMVCNDKRCLPPREIPFSIKIDGK